MRPVGSRMSPGVGELPSTATTGVARAARAHAGALGAAAARATAVAAGRDVVASAGSEAPQPLDEILGRVPPRGARGLGALLAPPVGLAPRGLPARAAALRRTARRARAAGERSDRLWCAASAAPGGSALQAAIDREQRLGEELEQLGALQDQVTAAMTAVSVG